MAINFTLYQTGDDPRKVGKTKTLIATHPILLKEGCSIDHPVVSFSAVSSAIAPANYAYIDAFQRYYWIKDRKQVTATMCELTLESDPWESFEIHLRNTRATLKRSADKFNGYLIDDQYQALAYKKIFTKKFNGTGNLSTDSFILMTVG